MEQGDRVDMDRYLRILGRLLCIKEAQVCGDDLHHHQQ